MCNTTSAIYKYIIKLYIRPNGHISHLKVLAQCKSREIVNFIKSEENIVLVHSVKYSHSINCLFSTENCGGKVFGYIPRMIPHQIV